MKDAPIPDDCFARIEWVDILRGCGMALIVLGHCLLGLMAAGLLDAAGWVRDAVLFLYLFHMPVIFYVSGFVSRDLDRTPRAFAAALGRWIVLPYIVWSAILVTVQNMAPSGANQVIPFAALAQIWREPVSLFWFLYALFIIKVAIYVLGRASGKPAAAALGLAALGLAVFYAAMGHPAFDLVGLIGGCAIFYGLGRFCAERRYWFGGLLTRLAMPGVAIPVGAACIALLAAATALYAGRPQDLRVLSGPQAGFPLTGIIGIVLCLALAVMRRGRAGLPARALRQIGIYSMVVYVQHPIWGAGVRSLLVKGGIASPVLVIAAAVGAGIVLPIVWQKIADRYGITRFFGIRPARS